MKKVKWNLWNKDWKDETYGIKIEKSLFFRIEKYLKPYKFVGSMYTYSVLEIYLTFLNWICWNIENNVKMCSTNLDFA